MLLEESANGGNLAVSIQVRFSRVELRCKMPDDWEV